MRSTILIGLGLLFVVILFGQPQAELHTSEIHLLETSNPQAYITWYDSDAPDPMSAQASRAQLLEPYADQMFSRGRSVVWLRMDIYNDLVGSQEFYLSFGTHEIVSLYKCRNNNCKIVGETGLVIAPKGRSIEQNESYLRISLDPLERASFYAKITSYQLNERRDIKPLIYNPHKFQEVSLIKVKKLNQLLIILGLFVGSFFAFIIYPLNLYITTGKSYYLFYVVHIAITIIALMMRVEIDFELDIFFAYYPKLSFALYDVSALFSIPFYLLFLITFLNLKETAPIFYKYIRIIFWVVIVMILLSVLVSLVFNQHYFTHDLIFFDKLLSMLVGLSIFYVFVSKGGSYKFVAIGTLFLVLGAMATNYLKVNHISVFNSSESSIWNWNLLYVHLGILVEFICFSLALGYNQNLVEREKESALKNWIAQLKENETIQEDYKMKLETDVKEQTNKILKIIKTLEEQERSQMESNFNKKFKEMELRALRAQMNPHFIFNSMNSIKFLIQKKDDERALDYLSRFSRLLRKSLQNASLLEVTLQEELDFCSLYLDIESLRFDDGFVFTFEVDEDVDTTFITIPPLLLQPYLENSLWHGLMHKEGNRKLGLFVKSSTEGLCEVIIDDNGIGREAAEVVKGARDIKRKSLGMTLTEERLKLTKERNNKEIVVVIKDKVDPSGRSAGTSVHLIIKS